jgi:multidrug efflux pump subunit AcrA (membrane-fusion protein)
MILPSRSLLAWTSLTLSLGLLGTGVFLVWKNNPRFRVAATRLPPPTAPASTGPGDTRSVVAGVGIVESAGRNVAVGSPLSGVVVAVPVEVGDRVTAGTPLIELDSRSARAAVAVSTKLTPRQWIAQRSEQVTWSGRAGVQRGAGGSLASRVASSHSACQRSCSATGRLAR